MDGMVEPIKASEAFHTTHWTLVLEAAHCDSDSGTSAFGKLYADYWSPVFAFLRRRGLSPEEAEDLAQDFFKRLVEKRALSRLQRDGGRFRSFLLGSLSNFLCNEWDRARAQKRGGGARLIPIDAEASEESFGSLQLPDDATPESVFEQQWALALLAQVSRRLQQEQARAGRADLFADLALHLQSDPAAIKYSEIALRHGMSEGAIKVTVHRLRQRYGAILREEIGRTVSTPEDIEDELNHLLVVVSG